MAMPNYHSLGGHFQILLFILKLNLNGIKSFNDLKPLNAVIETSVMA